MHLENYTNANTDANISLAVYSFACYFCPIFDHKIDFNWTQIDRFLAIWGIIIVVRSIVGLFVANGLLRGGFIVLNVHKVRCHSTATTIIVCRGLYLWNKR